MQPPATHAPQSPSALQVSADGCAVAAAEPADSDAVELPAGAAAVLLWEHAPRVALRQIDRTNGNMDLNMIKERT